MSGIVSLEGIDCAGKSSALEAIEERLDVVTSAEPRDSVLSEYAENEGVPEPARFFAYLADRSIHHDAIYEPATESGEWVVLDRYVDSTMAYQKIDLAAWSLPPSIIDYLMKSFYAMPATTILLDLPVDLALGRASSTDRGHDRGYLAEVRGEYLRLAERYDDRFVTVDAAQGIETVQDRVVEIVAETIDSNQ